MPVLNNPRHEKFCQELAKGASCGAAYMAAGYDSDEGSAFSAGSRLYKKDEIKARVAEIQERAASRVEEKIAVSKAWVIERLVQNVERAMQFEEIEDRDGGTGEFKYEGNVANRSLELIGKELGMFVDRKEVGAPGDFDGLEGNALRDKLADELVELGLADAAAALRPKGETEH